LVLLFGVFGWVPAPAEDGGDTVSPPPLGLGSAEAAEAAAASFFLGVLSFFPLVADEPMRAPYRPPVTAPSWAARLSVLAALRPEAGLGAEATGAGLAALLAFLAFGGGTSSGGRKGNPGHAPASPIAFYDATLATTPAL
jgi:hypothetical protein